MARKLSANQIRDFMVCPNELLRQSLETLRKTQLWGNDHNEAARRVVSEWSEQLSFPGLGLTEQHARRNGYLPWGPFKSSQIYTGSSVLHLQLGGMARYFVELLPVTEHTLAEHNPFYQQSYEGVILQILANQVPKAIAASQRMNWTG